MYTGKFPLPEATIYSRAVREGSQADTHDLGVINIPTVEPGIKGNMVFEYAFVGDGAFDRVRAWHIGSDFNVPLQARYVTTPPTTATQSFFSVDQPNVEIVDVKTLADQVIHGEVSAAPLDPPTNKIFVIRLQEFAGRATSVKLTLPVRLKSASIVSLTEDKVLAAADQIAPLTVAIKPYQTLTVRFEIE